MATSEIPDTALHSSSTQLDHIIILVSPSDFENVPSWLSDNFTIIEGGTHTKGTSRNKLIIFKDGTYLELFSWVDPQPDGVEPHSDFPSWADKSEGYIIDWALTGADAHGKYDEVTSRLKEMLSQGERLNVTYDEPLAGGRRRKDGQELRWVTIRPRKLHTRDGSSPPDVPFFCHDISNRVLRVPYTEGSMQGWQEVVAHPCGAVGISDLTVEVPSAELEPFAKLYEAILGTTASELKTGERTVYNFDIGSPERIVQLAEREWAGDSGAQDPSTASKTAGPLLPPCKIRLQAASDSDTEQNHSASGLKKLVLLTEKKELKGRRLDSGGFGTPILLG